MSQIMLMCRLCGSWTKCSSSPTLGWSVGCMMTSSSWPAETTEIQALSTSKGTFQRFFLLENLLSMIKHMLRCSFRNRESIWSSFLKVVFYINEKRFVICKIPLRYLKLKINLAKNWANKKLGFRDK